MQNDISTKTLMPVFQTTGCVGHLLRTAKGFRACDANDKQICIYQALELGARRKRPPDQPIK